MSNSFRYIGKDKVAHTPTDYSKYYTDKSRSYMNRALDASTLSQSSARRSIMGVSTVEQHRDDIFMARGEIITARDTTVVMSDEVETFRNETRTDRQAAQVARTGAETARDTAGTHATASATSASTAADILAANKELEFSVDTSVGTRVSIGDVDIYYDSGWRDMRGAADPHNWDFDFAASRFHLKRNLDTVELVLRVRIGPGYDGSSKDLTMTLMTGVHSSFQQSPPSYGTLGVSISNREIFSVTNGASSGGIYITGASEGSWELGQTLSLYTSWNTAASLPRSLPGDDPA